MVEEHQGIRLPVELQQVPSRILEVHFELDINVMYCRPWLFVISSTMYTGVRTSSPYPVRGCFLTSSEPQLGPAVGSTSCC